MHVFFQTRCCFRFSAVFRPVFRRSASPRPPLLLPAPAKDALARRQNMIQSFHTGFRPIIFSQILNVRAFLSVQNKSENHTIHVFYLLLFCRRRLKKAEPPLSRKLGFFIRLCAHAPVKCVSVRIRAACRCKPECRRPHRGCGR
mgnify:CR=1 FL=1